MPRTAAEYAAHEAELRRAAPPGFTTVVAPPFVVVGDGPPEIVRADARNVVARAAKMLQADYFPLEPGDIVDVWLFANEKSYRRCASSLFDHEPPSRTGYYAPCDHAILVNGAVGTGAVVHEMVHALMEANFPECPPWLNEGLACLYEQVEARDGHLRGRLNWRVDQLKQAIRAGRAPRLELLLQATPGAFYESRQRQLHYAAARYVCFYLQEHDLLVRYFARLRARRGDDQGGWHTLLETLHQPDGEALQKAWEKFVLELPDPELDLEGERGAPLF